VRPSLLPRLLVHRSIPVDAVIALASKAGPELVAALLANLDILPTTVLLALKKNPAYQDSQKRAATVSSAVVQERHRGVLEEHRKVAAQNHLAEMIEAATADRSARASLRELLDDELLDILRGSLKAFSGARQSASCIASSDSGASRYASRCHR
jgi:hypothetical protein